MSTKQVKQLKVKTGKAVKSAEAKTVEKPVAELAPAPAAVEAAPATTESVQASQPVAEKKKSRPGPGEPLIATARVRRFLGAENLNRAVLEVLTPVRDRLSEYNQAKEALAKTDVVLTEDEKAKFTAIVASMDEATLKRLTLTSESLDEVKIRIAKDASNVLRCVLENLLLSICDFAVSNADGGKKIERENVYSESLYEADFYRLVHNLECVRKLTSEGRKRALEAACEAAVKQAVKQLKSTHTLKEKKKKAEPAAAPVEAQPAPAVEAPAAEEPLPEAPADPASVSMFHYIQFVCGAARDKHKGYRFTDSFKQLLCSIAEEFIARVSIMINKQIEYNGVKTVTAKIIENVVAMMLTDGSSKHDVVEVGTELLSSTDAKTGKTTEYFKVTKQTTYNGCNMKYLEQRADKPNQATPAAST
jgi:histone H3/H4